MLAVFSVSLNLVFPIFKLVVLLLSHQHIQPVDSEYREGHEYHLTQFIKEGSYGEVYEAQDINTGFRFAAKKVSEAPPYDSFQGVKNGHYLHVVDSMTSIKGIVLCRQSWTLSTLN